MDRKDPIVISGIGLVTPLGHTREKTWSRVLAGDTGIQKTPFGLEAPVMDFTLNGAKSRAGDFALTAAEEALLDAGISEAEMSSRTIGCAVSLSKPLVTEEIHPLCGLPQKAANHFQVTVPQYKTHSVLNPSLLLSSFTGWAPDSLIRSRFHLTGPVSNFIGACATGAVSLSSAVGWIEDGLCEGAFVGAAESSLVGLYRAGFKQMGVLSEGASPESVRPFDRNRNGFAMGEGAAVLYIERSSTAKKRGQKPIASIQKTVLAQSSSDSLRFDSGGEGVCRLMSKLISVEDPVTYVNAHGTGTWLNDQQETDGLNLFLSERKKNFYVSSTKAATGHLLGAAGALEIAISALSLRDGKVPPNLHLTQPDPHPEFPIPTHTLDIPIEAAVSLSYGFGGQMGGVYLKKGTDV